MLDTQNAGIVVAVSLAVDGQGVLQERLGHVELLLFDGHTREGDEGPGDVRMVVAQHLTLHRQHVPKERLGGLRPCQVDPYVGSGTNTTAPLVR